MSGKLRNYPQAVNAFYYLVPGKEVTFKVIRGVRVMDLKVMPVEDPRYSLLPKEEKKGRGEDRGEKGRGREGGVIDLIPSVEIRE